MNTALIALAAFAAAVAGLAAGQIFGLAAGTTGLIAFALFCVTAHTAAAFGDRAAKAKTAKAQQ